MDGAARSPATGGELLVRLVLFALLTAVLTLAAGFLLPAGGVVAGSATLAFAGIAAGWALLHRDGWPAGSLGLVPDRRAVAETAAGTGVGVGVAAVAMGLMAAAGGLTWTSDAAPFAAGAWAAEGVRSLVWLAMPAAAEEILLRGYVLGAAARVAGPGPALWATSVAFGLLHAFNPGAGVLAVAGTAAAGLFLGALVLGTGSLWPAIGAHLGWNWALAFLADVPVSGLEVADAPGFDGVVQGPAWLGGGAFGVEASALAVTVLAIAAWVVWRRGRIPAPPRRPAPLWDEATSGHDQRG